MKRFAVYAEPCRWGWKTTVQPAPPKEQGPDENGILPPEYEFRSPPTYWRFTKLGAIERACRKAAALDRAAERSASKHRIF